MRKRVRVEQPGPTNDEFHAGGDPTMELCEGLTCLGGLGRGDAPEHEEHHRVAAADPPGFEAEALQARLQEPTYSAGDGHDVVRSLVLPRQCQRQGLAQQGGV